MSSMPLQMGTITMTEKAPPGGGTVSTDIYYKAECQMCSPMNEPPAEWSEIGLDLMNCQDAAIAHVNVNPSHIVKIETFVLDIAQHTEGGVTQI
jgi:hypothetical protein